MKILVTGASGFVGSHLVPSLLSAGHAVIAAGRSDKGLKTAFPEKEEELALVATSYDDDGLGRLFRDHEIEAVLHLAAKLPSGDESDGLKNYVDANVLLLERIFNAASFNNVKNVVSLSSQSVYSSSNSLPFSENGPAQPDNPYGLSKLIGEEIAGMYNRARGMQIKSLRVAQLVGRGVRGGYMLSTFIEKAMRGEQLTLRGKGRGARDYLYIEDLCAAILAAFSCQSGGIFNIGSGRSTTHGDLARTINLVFENSADIAFEKDKKADESVRYLDASRAERLLGWAPSFDLQKGLESYKKNLDIKKK